MKRVLQHPAPSTTGKQYWRSLGELSDTPEFRGWLEREFPAGAQEMEADEVSRRSFLKLMGASMALAGFGLNSCRKPEMHLVPFTKSAEWTIPGKPLYYATAMPRRHGAMPLVVSTVDGRPIKIEGNPNQPDSNGATDAFAQASVLDLYDPARSQRFVRENKLSDQAAFEKYIAELRPKMAANGGASLAFLVEETHSPTRDRLRQELQKQFPRMRWCVYDPLLSEAQVFATQMSFGENTRLIPQFDKADVILSLDSDFLNSGEGDLASVRAFSARRRVREAKDSMNRLYVVENHFTLTGAMADHRLRFPASQIPSITHALASKIAVATKDPGLSSVLITLKAPVKTSKYDAKWLDEAAADLLSKPGASLVLAGSHQPVVVQLMVYGINAALKNIGTTLLLRALPPASRKGSILQLASDIDAGRVEQLFILGGDPVYNAPALHRSRPQDKASDRLARVAEAGAQRHQARAIRRCDLGVEPVAHPGCPLSGIVERRTHAERRLCRDAAAHSAPFRRTVGARSHADAPRPAESGGPAIGSGNFPPDRAAGRIRHGLEQVFARRLCLASDAERQSAEI